MTPSILLVAVLGSGATIEVDLSQIGHIPSKGRVQDADGSQVVQALIKAGPDAVQFLVDRIQDETVVHGPVLDYWPLVRVGDVALVVLCDLFTLADQSRSTIPGMGWDELLERPNADLSAPAVLERFLASHGRAGLQRKVEALLKSYRGRIVWDSTERCFTSGELRRRTGA